MQVNNVKRMVLHCAKLVVPSLLLVSERIIVEFGLVGILRLCANNPRPEALKMQRCIQSKGAKFSSSTWLLYPHWGSGRGAMWKRCWGQWNRVSAEGKGGVRAWLWHMDISAASTGIWHPWNFRSAFRKARRWLQTWLKVSLRKWSCQCCQHERNRRKQNHMNRDASVKLDKIF